MVELCILVDAVARGDGGDGGKTRSQDVILAPLGALFELFGGLVGLIGVRVVFGATRVAADGAAGPDFGFASTAGHVAVGVGGRGGGGGVVMVTANKTI